MGPQSKNKPYVQMPLTEAIRQAAPRRAELAKPYRQQKSAPVVPIDDRALAEAHKHIEDAING